VVLQVAISTDGLSWLCVMTFVAQVSVLPTTVPSSVLHCAVLPPLLFTIDPIDASQTMNSRRLCPHFSTFSLIQLWLCDTR